MLVEAPAFISSQHPTNNNDNHHTFKRMADGAYRVSFVIDTVYAQYNQQ